MKADCTQKLTIKLMKKVVTEGKGTARAKKQKLGLDSAVLSLHTFLSRPKGLEVTPNPLPQRSNSAFFKTVD